MEADNGAEGAGDDERPVANDCCLVRLTVSGEKGGVGSGLIVECSTAGAEKGPRGDCVDPALSGAARALAGVVGWPRFRGLAAFDFPMGRRRPIVLVLESASLSGFTGSAQGLSLLGSTAVCGSLDRARLSSLRSRMPFALGSRSAAILPNPSRNADELGCSLGSMADMIDRSDSCLPRFMLADDGPFEVFTPPVDCS